MSFRTLAAVPSVALLASLTACADVSSEGTGSAGEADQAAGSYPERSLDAEEMQSLLPPQDHLPEGLELSEDGVRSDTSDLEEWTEQLEGYFDHQEEMLGELESFAGTPGAEECAAAVEAQTAEARQHLQELEEEDPGQTVTDVRAEYRAGDGEEVVVTLIPKTRSLITIEAWMDQELVCAELPVGYIEADSVEAIEGESAQGIVTHHGGQMELVLSADFGGTGLEVFVAAASDQEQEFLEGAEQIVGHVEAELTELAESEQ